MEHVLKITVFGLLSGILGTSIGGLMAFFIGNIKKRTLSLILEFSAGLMTSVVCFELIPEAFELGGTEVTIIGVVAGILSIVIIENFIKKAKYIKKRQERSGLLKTGILVAIGIALHNFPEGFAVGSGMEASLTLGLTITAVIIIHDIPEGVAIAVPMRAGGVSKWKAFLLTVASGLPMGLGAFAGSLLGEISSVMVSGCLGFAGGAMLYIVFGELVPESKKLYLGRLSSIGNIIGILCGIIISTYC